MRLIRQRRNAIVLGLALLMLIMTGCLAVIKSALVEHVSEKAENVFMQAAIHEAMEGIAREQGGPFGSVVVRDRWRPSGLPGKSSVIMISRAVCCTPRGNRARCACSPASGRISSGCITGAPWQTTSESDSGTRSSKISMLSGMRSGNTLSASTVKPASNCLTPICIWTGKSIDAAGQTNCFDAMNTMLWRKEHENSLYE